MQLQTILARAAGREEGQALTEYALILALVAVVTIIGLKFLGGRVTASLSSVATSL